jgi:hypothetical protein
VIAPAGASGEDIYRYGKAHRATHLVLVKYLTSSGTEYLPEMATDKFALLKEFNFQIEIRLHFRESTLDHLRQKILVYRLV